MYRLLRVRGVPLACLTSTSSSFCLTCNYLRSGVTPFNTSQLRGNSSTINNVMLSSVGKKKLKKKPKKYAELLEVTDTSTNNRKAAVQKFNSAQLSLLVDQPDITLDKLHKIKSKSMQKKSQSNQKSSIKNFSTEAGTGDQNSTISTTNFSNFSNDFNSDAVNQDDTEFFVEDLKASGIMDESTIIKSISFVDQSLEESIEHPSEKIFSKSKISKKKKKSLSEKEKKAREAYIHQEKIKQYNKALLSYFNVCVNSNIPINNQMLYKWSRNIRYPKKFYIDDVSVYNVYIEKLASQANIAEVLKILELLRKSNIDFNVQTYMYVFDCVGRVKEHMNKSELLQKLHLEMEKDNISLNDIITKSTFLRDQRKFVENMVKLLDKEFQPVYNEELDTKYDCKTLEKLKEENASPSSTIQGLLSREDLEARLQKQINAEIEGQVTIRNISKKNLSTKNVTFMRNKLQHFESEWKKIALVAFKRDLKTLKSDEYLNAKSKPFLHPYLLILKPEDYVTIIMREVRRIAMGSETYSLPFNSLCRNLGAQVYKMYESKTKKANGIIDKTIEVYRQYCDWFLKRDDKHNSRVKWTLLEHEANKHGVTLNSEVPAWQSNINFNIGKFLYEIILNDLKIDLKPSNIDKRRKFNVISKTSRQYGIKRVFGIKPHPELVKLYLNSNPETLNFDVSLVPSVCPPRPWTSIHYGGYMVSKTDIVRLAQMGNQQWDRLASAPPKKLHPALDSLNQLGSIPWAVNTAVLDVLIKVFQDNGSVELNIPQPPWIMSPIPLVPKDASAAEKKENYIQRKELERKKSEMYSLWCDALYRLSLANHFRDDIFWLPHNMDFRGRVYPVPPHLSHLGSDMARSILVFALKKPLGFRGLDWLKLHCINLTGFKKKEPLRERLKFANENIDKILDSAENPLTGQKWWVKSDEPWQTLATCMEIAAALKSPNPEKFMSGFPIHQDGSCNGLQHYAALGRDQIGAESVNLHPSDAPQDVYSSVAAIVDKLRQEDAKNTSSPHHEIANILEGFVQRKVIKQTVMTTVYGVTKYGAKLQIVRQLKDVEDFPEKYVWRAGTYLALKTFQTLRTMFQSAREIQDWLTECSRLVCSARGENMEWVTPLGLPVVQPYSKIDWSLSNKDKNTSPIFTMDIYRKPNIMKQRNAFAPNFVHSLDSSHMMLTSLHIEQAGVTFVSVHDCYWTHPCTVEIMNKICREQFVSLHSEPILHDLSKFLVKKFGHVETDSNGKDELAEIDNESLGEEIIVLNKTFQKVPKQGDFDLKGVLSSTYFFS